ncbi:EAL and HDOD domain-containing protein [Candidatus Nitronereus thalassa]|uniref:HDOD domain-containing protein n=1 Tax=Candidatus Nitronereus thalassa TaxID=3020898 RepID=A0ABU3KA34_9BACT|nr:HDOD domain-containing protein [Candidatus Nitronereus thalassa]MDT7043260.1 HDOD domain-containing protein [Candidatus Nitronereus thalassa]
MSTILARQPIHDHQLSLFGYELLSRQIETDPQTAFDGEAATDTVMKKAFDEIGLDTLVGPNRAFINLTEKWVLSEECHSLPKDRIVLEVLEHVPPKQEVISALERLHDKGYTIALDDFVFHEDKVPFLELADIVKIDVLDKHPDYIKQQRDLVAPFKTKLLAERVESYDLYDSAKLWGFDLFQGYFFFQPGRVESTTLPSNQMTTLTLLSKLQDPDIEIEDVDQIIKQDMSLSFKLLDYVNSAHFSLPQKIDSIPLAARLVGLNQIKTWTILLSMVGVPNKPFELIVTSIVRAIMAEHLAVTMKVPDSEPYFTVGLFSVLDALFDLPMATIIQNIPLSEESQDALVFHEGMMGATLKCVLSYERGHWEGVNTLYLDANVIQESYFEALRITSNLWSLLR